MSIAVVIAVIGFVIAVAVLLNQNSNKSNQSVPKKQETSKHIVNENNNKSEESNQNVIQTSTTSEPDDVDRGVVIVHAGVAEKLSSNNEPIGEATVFHGNWRYDLTRRDHVTYFAKFSGAVSNRTRFSAKVFHNGKEPLYTHHCEAAVAKDNDGTYSCRPGPYYLPSGNWEIRLFADQQEVNRIQFEIVPGQ